jgi:hypothetical protein
VAELASFYDGQRTVGEMLNSAATRNSSSFSPVCPAPPGTRQVDRADQTIRRPIPHRRRRHRLGQPKPLAGTDGQDRFTLLVTGSIASVSDTRKATTCLSSRRE